MTSYWSLVSGHLLSNLSFAVLDVDFMAVWKDLPIELQKLVLQKLGAQADRARSHRSWRLLDAQGFATLYGLGGVFDRRSDVSSGQVNMGHLNRWGR